jgi:predicted permease
MNLLVILSKATDPLLLSPQNQTNAVILSKATDPLLLSPRNQTNAVILSKATDPLLLSPQNQTNAVMLSKATDPLLLSPQNQTNAVILSGAQRSRRTCGCISFRTEQTVSLSSLKSGLKSLFQKPRVDRELEEELDTYEQASAAHKQLSGMDPAAARRAARAEIGSRAAVKHQVWSVRWESHLDNFLQDLRLAFRGLAKSPGFTFVALLSLALGIGANTAIFTLIQQVLLRNLPVQHPEQLVTFGPSLGGGINGGVDLGTHDLYTYEFARQLEAQPGPFQSVASFLSFSPQVTVKPPKASGSSNTRFATIQVKALPVSGNFFSTVGASALMGRTILPYDTTGENAASGHNPIVVLSYHFWQQQLNGDPNVLGKILSINNTPFRIVGVMPSAFLGVTQEVEPTELWVPIAMQQQIMLEPDMLTGRDYYLLHMIARRTPQSMKAGISQDQLWLDSQIRNYIRAGEGSVIAPDRQLEIEHISRHLTPAAHGISGLSAQYGESLKLLILVSAVVLLIACANLANFLLARAASRQREIATRLALGSTRARIIRQSLVETLLLSLLGGACGLALAPLGTRVLIAFVAAGATSSSLSATPDATILVFTLAVSLLTGLLFGIAPAMEASRTAAGQSLSSNSRSTSASPAARFVPKLLVTAQVTFSLLLLIGSGLFLRSLNNLQSQDFGFERTHLLLASFDPKVAGYTPDQSAALDHTLVERLAAIPGVRSAALSLSPPIGFGNWASSITVPGYVLKPREVIFSVLNRVSGQYFATTGIAIVAGRPIQDFDTAVTVKVAVVNQTFARRYFPKGNAIGSIVQCGIDSVAGPWRIVGIAHDSLIASPRDTPANEIYLPLDQIAGKTNDAYAATIELRTAADPATSINDLRRVLADVNPNLPVTHIQTIREQVNQTMTQDELISSLTAVFSALALFLAAIGLYGVISYSVIRRTGEIGLRLALGAQTQSVLWLVLRESLILLAIGLAVGLPLTLACTRIAAGFLKSQLYGIHATDPATIAAAIAVVSAMTLIAAWLPARRAARIDPMQALRCD